MPEFEFSARNASGSAISGIKTASSESEVARQLLSESMTPTEIVRKVDRLSLWDTFKAHVIGYFTIDKRDFRLFALKMSVLLRSGVSIKQAVGDLADASKSPILKITLKKIEEKLTAGYDLASAFSGFPRVFSNLYIAFLKQSENNGKAYQVFDQIAKTMDTQHLIRQKLLSPLLPYLFTAIVVAIVTVFLSDQALPMFEQAQARSGGIPLPESTMLLLGIMRNIRYWYLYIAGIMGLVMVMMWCRRYEQFAMIFDRMLLRIPLSGVLLRSYALGEFLRACTLALENRLNIQDAVRIAIAVLRNGYLKKQMEIVYQHIQTGEQLWAAMEKSNLFSTLDIHLFRLGERTGEMSLALENLVSLNQESFEHELSMTSETLRLMIIALLAAAVIIVAFGFYFGLWTLTNMSPR